jgi:hypothetical protein
MRTLDRPKRRDVAVTSRTKDDDASLLTAIHHVDRPIVCHGDPAWTVEVCSRAGTVTVYPVGSDGNVAPIQCRMIVRDIEPSAFVCRE